MGSAASSSLLGSSSVDESLARELAGEGPWENELKSKYMQIANEKGTVTLDDIRKAAPYLFDQEKIDLDKAKEMTLAVGVEWNEELNTIFESNADAGETKTISILKWKSLVPTLFESPEEREARLDAEFKAVLAARSEGTIVVNYQMYNEEFPISGNMLTAARIDEDYGLTDVMPGCRIRLSTIDSKARTLYENANIGRAVEAPWVKEDPIGTFKELLAGEKYYCLVIEDPEKYAKDMEELKKRIEADGGVSNEGKSRRDEGCSCLFGNPCMDQYICKDWDNKFAVAKKNGWKGF